LGASGSGNGKSFGSRAVNSTAGGADGAADDDDALAAGGRTAEAPLAFGFAAVEVEAAAFATDPAIEVKATRETAQKTEALIR
jgi:hypothetical protein